MTDAIVLPTHPRFKNLEGQIFGRLTVVSYAGKSNSKKSLWTCICECGNETTVMTFELTSTGTRSCGCLRKDVHTTHGKCTSQEYRSWSAMLQRCCNENSESFARYGGRGILVCERWQNSFENFLADMGCLPSKNHSIEREDNNGNYCIENCRWATRVEQARNTKRNRMLTHDGRTQCLAAWAEELGLHSRTLHNRIVRGKWSVERALTTPVK
jgi:hypothetical protein